MRREELSKAKDLETIPGLLMPLIMMIVHGRTIAPGRSVQLNGGEKASRNLRFIRIAD
jgi:hypothetical protein